MKLYLGIDPGKKGAMVFLNEDASIVSWYGMPLTGKEYDRQRIKKILLSHKVYRVAIENPTAIFGTSKSSFASLRECVGMLYGMCEMAILPYILVQPKEWQKECWKHVQKQKDPKKTSTLAAQNLWMDTDFCITNNGNPSRNYNDGYIDAALIAEYARRNF